MSTDRGWFDGGGTASGGPALHGWTDSRVVGVGLVALAAGFGQFGLVSTLGDVARHFGHLASGTTLADRAGLSGTELGLGLALVRLASLGGLPLSALADRIGRRRVLLVSCGLGLALTAAAAASPSYWLFVAIFALGRPLLSASAAVAQVDAAEQTAATGRASAVGLVAAGYAFGAGLTAIVYGLAGSAIGYRGILALTLVPLLALPLIARLVAEPDRFVRLAAVRAKAPPVLGSVGLPYRRRLATVTAIGFSLSVITGPANSFVFVYAQNIEHLSGRTTSAMVAGAGVVGLGGLLVGRFLADRVGRRPTAAAAMVGIGLAGILCYSGGTVALVGGYLVGILAGGVFAPSGGAYVNELFPTGVRASVAGWYVAGGVLGGVLGLVVFGEVADVGNRFGPAALVTFIPAAAFAGLFLALPETRGREPESLWGDPD